MILVIKRAWISFLLIKKKNSISNISPSYLHNTGVKRCSFLSASFMSIMYELLTKCEVKMAGYWPIKFFFFACFWTETKLRSINSLSGKFFLRDRAGSPERARWLHLARSGSQSQRTIWFILLARGASHIISTNIAYC